MPRSNNEDDQLLVADVVDKPVVPDADAIAFGIPLELLATPRAGLGRELLGSPEHPLSDLRREPAQFSFRVSLELDGVPQARALTPNSSISFSMGIGVPPPAMARSAASESTLSSYSRKRCR